MANPEAFLFGIGLKIRAALARAGYILEKSKASTHIEQRQPPLVSFE